MYDSVYRKSPVNLWAFSLFIIYNNAKKRKKTERTSSCHKTFAKRNSYAKKS